MYCCLPSSGARSSLRGSDLPRWLARWRIIGLICGRLSVVRIFALPESRLIAGVDTWSRRIVANGSPPPLSRTTPGDHHVGHV